MADPRFYDNRGPLTLAVLCAGANVAVPQGADGGVMVTDVAGLAQAGPTHLSFFAGRRTRNDLLDTMAGWCLVGQGEEVLPLEGTVSIRVDSVPHAFAAIAKQFYPEYELVLSMQEQHIHPSAQIGDGAVLGPGVVVGPGAEIGRGTFVGGNAVIGRGVAIGRNCEIGSNVSLAFAYLGDDVVVQSGARIGGSGFGFASDQAGHIKIPQLGRVIVQDRVEIGANSTIDRGALIDTVLGEGCKIDNLVQIGHNSRIGRHCVIVGQSGVSGSVTIGDYAIIGGKVGVADHVTIGDGARVGGLAGVTRDLPGGRDYGGHPARPLREWLREAATLAKLTKAHRYSGDE